MLTFAIQWVGYDYGQFDPDEATDFAGFMDAIDTFPWAEQHEKWNDTQDGPLPALALRNEKDPRELAITALSADLTRDFQVFSASTQPRKGLFGMGKAKMKQQVKTLSAPGRSDVNLLCQLFCGGQYEALDREVDRLIRRYGDE